MCVFSVGLRFSFQEKSTETDKQIGKMSQENKIESNVLGKIFQKWQNKF